MTQAKDTVVRLSTLGGTWETVGVDRLRGIVAEVDKLDADEWGSSSCSFSLHRDPGMMWPDLGAFSDVEVEVGGVTVWDGRISESPTADGDDPVVNVQCEGWRSHLDDDTYRCLYIASRLTDFNDSRSILATDLNLYRVAGNVSTDKGLALGWGTNDPIPSSTRVGATFDAGPGQTITAMVYELTYRNAHTAAMEFWILGTISSAAPNAGDNITALTASIPAATAETAAASNTVTFSTPCRYVHVYWRNSLADVAASAGEIYARLRSVILVSNNAYTSGITAPTVVKDALSRATLLLSADRTGIDPNAAATFTFPEFNLDGQKTPREVIDAANAAMNWRSKVAVGRRMIFEPKPAVAALEVGQWPGCEFADASANSGADIYNRVVVEGTGPGAEKISVERSASQQPGVTSDALATPAPSNPSFNPNTTSWTPSAGTTIVLSTTVFDTSPASGFWQRSSSAVQPGDKLTETFSGTFQAGATYLLTMKVAGSSVQRLTATLGVAGDVGTATQTVTASFAPFTVAWTPSAASTGVTLTLGVDVVDVASSGIRIDSLVLTAAKPTLVDRRGFRRTHVLPVKSALTNQLAVQIGDTWLAAHKTTPLKGTVRVTGDRAVRHILTGQNIPPEQLLLATGDMLRLSHRVDPDTGGQGRDGRIASASYDPSTDTTTVAIDSSRTSVDALLERLALVTGTA